MRDSILVSVIIPFYNEEKYLCHSLSSLTDQSYQNIEIIAVDDGSTDKSSDIVKKFKIKLISQEHQGPGAARNRGVLDAKGKIIVFIDADMYFDNKFVEKLIKPIVEKKAIGTFTKEELVANAGNIWSRCWNINSGLPPGRRIPEDHEETEIVFRAILKEYFIKAAGFETNVGYADDLTLSNKLKLAALNAKGAICYHYNPSSLGEVYISSRWIGRSNLFELNAANFLRFSFFNSLRVGLKYLFHGAPLAIFAFKAVYDFGIFTGIFFGFKKTFK